MLICKRKLKNLGEKKVDLGQPLQADFL